MIVLIRLSLCNVHRALETIRLRLDSNRDNEDTQQVTESVPAVMFSFRGLSLSSSSFCNDLLRRCADRTAERRKSG